MTRLRFDRGTAWGAFLFFATATLNLTLLSKTYVFEGLARAMPIELDRFRDLFNGNYILYGVIGWIFHRLLSLYVELSAVTSLQILDAVLGAAGAWLFYRILRKIGLDLVLALLGACALATTLGYWRWSTDAEDYIFSTFLLIVNFYFLVTYSRDRRPRPAALGALHALAVGGHIVNLAFAPVILWFIARANPDKWKRPVAEYAATALVAIGTAYAIALWIVHPANASDALRWFWGSANRATGVSFGGGQSPWKLWLWMRTSIHALTSFSPRFVDGPRPGLESMLVPGFLWIARLLMFFLAADLAWNFRRLSAEHRKITIGCLIWIGAYAIIFSSWQPDTLVYRTTDLPPILLLLSLSARRMARTGVAVLASLSLCLFIGNLGAEILPRSCASNNPDLARMSFIRDHTAPSDWITGGGGGDELYLPFFAQRRPLVIERFRERPDELLAFFQQAQARKERVYITSRTLEDPLWREFFSRTQLVEFARTDTGFALYRLEKIRPDAPKPPPR